LAHDGHRQVALPCHTLLTKHVEISTLCARYSLQ